MTETNGEKKTPIHDAHVAAGARMVPFAGWRMPLQYSGVLDEHDAVRTRAGLFDVSHMGEVRVRGPRALDYLQYLTCNNVARLEPGRAHYNGLMTPNGGFVDDLLVYRLQGGEYLLVLNAANTPKDLAWLDRHAVDFEVEVRDESAAWAQLALQGPAAEPLVAQWIGASVSELRYYGFVQIDVEGADCLVSRTGYTGEDGFEFYAPHDAGPRLWHRILELGGERGIVPVGLAARDTLRLEAKMALYGNDIDETTTAYEADLGWIVKPNKGEFVGRAALLRQRQEGLRRKLVGFEMLGRAIARPGYSVLAAGREVGKVSSGSFAPFLEKNIGLVYLPIEMTGIGSRFEVSIRGKPEPARVVPTPFYRRER